MTPTPSIVATGLRYPGGDRFVPPIAEQDFGRSIEGALAGNADSLRTGTQQTRTSFAFREEMEAQPSADPADPRAAGWTYLLNQRDPDRQAIIDILRRLAVHRGMTKPSAPCSSRATRIGPVG